jgi:hypothetical protein
MQQRSERKAHTVRRKYFGEEYVFEFIWQHCDNDGLWTGDAESVASEFDVTEDAAHEALGDLCDRGLIQKLESAKYIVTKWRERDDGEEVVEW